MITGCSFLGYARIVEIDPWEFYFMIKTRFQISLPLISMFLVSSLLASCQAAPGEDFQPAQHRLSVVATTTFLGDVVGEIADDEVELIVLLEPGQNPHSYLASPRDMVNVSEADLIIVNGLGLEEFLDELLKGTGAADRLVIASEGIVTLAADDSHDDQAGDVGSNASLGLDPHVWMNPNNVKIWVDNITDALAQNDPANSDLYRANAEAYLKQLVDLDIWIRAEIETIPENNRELVSDHISLGYFAREYGLEQIGAVIPALTTEAETSGQQLADLIETIRNYQARAIFVGADFDPTLAQRVSDETGAELVRLYFGSLSDGLPAGTYLSFMRFNVEAITNALQE
jgi:ABC-type Zn uptake system ZnuABC Zn-binding protein ZnuA